MMGSYPKHFQPTNINLIELSKGRVKEVICILKWVWHSVMSQCVKRSTAFHFISRLCQVKLQNTV